MTGEAGWGLKRAPFESGPDPELFFPSEDHREAVARLEFLAREGGTQLGLLTGGIGCGKSMVRAVFARQSSASRLVAQLPSSHYPFPALLRSILGQFGASDPGGGTSEFDLVTRLRRTTANASRRPPAVPADACHPRSWRCSVGG